MTIKQLIDLHGFGKWFKHNADTNYEFMPLRFSSIRPHWIIGEINRGYNPATCFSENDEGWELKEEPKPIRVELPQNPTITWTCKCGYSHSLNFACDKCGMKVGGYAGTGCAVSPSPEKPKVKRALYAMWVKGSSSPPIVTDCFYKDEEEIKELDPADLSEFGLMRLTETEREFDF